MHNDYLENLIAKKKEVLPTETDDLKKLKEFFVDKEKELQEMERAVDLSQFSTTQLKAELRRRKKLNVRK